MDPQYLVTQRHLIAGKYLATRFLGQGAFGAVYCCDQLGPGGESVREVAVKVISLGQVKNPAEVTRLVLRELQTLASARHDNVVALHDFGESPAGSDPLLGHYVHVVMELCRSTLEQRLSQLPRMSAVDAVELGRDVAAALSHLLAKGIAHRDLKPANILRLDGNRPRWVIADFGLARGFEKQQTTATGAVGTPQYLAPETLSGQTGPAVDVWALGAILQECITGSLPYAGGTPEQLYAAILTTPPRIEATLPPQLAPVVRGCLVKDPAQRWTAPQVVAALGGQAAVAVSAPPEQPTAQAAAGTPRVVVQPPPPSSSLLVRFNAPMVRCPPAGSPPFVFTMGSWSEMHNRPHTVTLARAFEIGKYPVTQELYAAVMREVPGADADPSYYNGPRRPVEQVSWDDAVAFCNAISAREGLTAAYSGSGDSVRCNWSASGYRLPTAAEWEYACRAGTSEERYGELNMIGWHRENADGRTHDVGEPGKAANEWGLHDTIGNVWEWCWDSIPPREFRFSGPARAKLRVCRGGSWAYWAAFATASKPTYQYPDTRRDYLGLRLSRTL